MSTRQTLVSVDLDDAACYHAIHGLPPPKADVGGVLTRCLPRFLELFAGAGVRATFFVIGRDLERDMNEAGRGADLLRQAVGDGHELGNHSFAHAYDMVRWPLDRITDDLQRCDTVLRAIGAEPQRFRAPGYTHDERLLGCVASVGYAYDSSALPSPAYFAAKWLAVAALRLRGRDSAAMATGARAFFGPTQPHYLEGPGLWELPMSVTPRTRLPLIGTSVLTAPQPLGSYLRRSARALPNLHLELHGIDLADMDRDPFAAPLRRRQLELRVPLAVRRERLRELLGARGPTTLLRDAVG